MTNRPAAPEGILTNVTRTAERGRPDAAIHLEEAVQIMDRPTAARVAYVGGSVHVQPFSVVSIEIDVIDAGPNALSRVGDIAIITATCGNLTITSEVEITEAGAADIERALEVVGEVAGHERDAA